MNNAILRKYTRLLPATAAVLLMLGATAPAAYAQNGAQGPSSSSYGGDTGSSSDRSATKAGTKAGTEVDDTMITSKVKTALIKDPEIKSLKISVSTENGNVTLNGKAKNDTQIARAVQIASSTKGVKTVTNNLAVGD